eukprot:4214057-Pyramimonas_sp.AAC.1
MSWGPVVESKRIRADPPSSSPSPASPKSAPQRFLNVCLKAYSYSSANVWANCWQRPFQKDEGGGWGGKSLLKPMTSEATD